MRILRLLSSCLVICTLLSFSRALADWPSRSDSAVPVSASAGAQWNARLTSDGASGAIIAWQDRRGGSSDKIYLQHFSRSGVPLWTDGGIQISYTPGYQYYPQIVPDGAGGVYITWQDNRSGIDYNIYVQHVTSDGLPAWAANGTVVCNAAGHQYNPQLALAGDGGIIVTWQDRRSGAFDIYAQKFDANGSSQWTYNGISVCGSVYDQIEPKLVGDGSGGAVITWLDYRDGSGFTDIFCQHVLANGSMLWTGNGVPVCIAPNIQWNAQILDDGNGKSIVVWQDRRTGNSDNIFAQKINGAGDPEWTANGVALASIPGTQYYPQAVTDHHGGAVVVWQDNRTGSDYNIVAQRISTNGQLLWSPAGLSVCGATGHQYNPQIVTQGIDYIATWQDKRNGEFDVFAQRFRENGTMLWQTNGVIVNSLPKDQFMPQIVGDNVNGAIIAWADYHLGSGSTDIFAQRIGANGLNAGGSFRTFSQDAFALKAAIFRNRLPPHNIIALPNEGNVRDSIFGRGAFSQGVVLGIERFDSSRTYGWVYFTRSIYVRRAFVQNGGPRAFDRLYERPFIGMLKNAAVWRYNNKLSGELLALKLSIAASDVGLTPADLGEIVFRDSASASNPLNNMSLRAIAAKVDTILTYWKKYPANYTQLASSLVKINNAFAAPVDTISTGPLLLTAPKAMFSVPFLIPGVEIPAPPPNFTPEPDDAGEPIGFDLAQNYPNPFNPITTIEFTLPEASVVSLRVFNILGQEVAKLVDNSTIDNGHQIIDFDATRLSSGVYFYQLMADPLSGQGKLISQVKKMILIK